MLALSLGEEVTCLFQWRQTIRFTGGLTVKSHVGSLPVWTQIPGMKMALYVAQPLHGMGEEQKPCKGIRSGQLSHEIRSPEKFAEEIALIALYSCFS